MVMGMRRALELAREPVGTIAASRSTCAPHGVHVRVCSVKNVWGNRSRDISSAAPVTPPTTPRSLDGAMCWVALAGALYWSVAIILLPPTVCFNRRTANKDGFLQVGLDLLRAG